MILRVTKEESIEYSNVNRSAVCRRIVCCLFDDNDDDGEDDVASQYKDVAHISHAVSLEPRAYLFFFRWIGRLDDSS